MAITDFHLLLLEDDASRRASLAEAAGKAGVTSLRILAREEVRNYLDRVAVGHLERERLPTLLATPLDGASSLRLLAWLNGRPEFRRIITIGLIKPQDGQWVGQAYDLRINSCLVRPDDFDGQVELFRSIRQYWEKLNHAESP
jgi:hypothetical protein